MLICRQSFQAGVTSKCQVGASLLPWRNNKEAIVAGVAWMRGGETGNGAREVTRLNGIGPDRQL